MVPEIQPGATQELGDAGGEGGKMSKSQQKRLLKDQQVAARKAEKAKEKSAAKEEAQAHVKTQASDGVGEQPDQPTQ